MDTKDRKKEHDLVFDLNGGMPRMAQALPLAFQHIVAMVVGCVTPAIIIAGVAGLNPADKVIIVQAALVISALATLLQVFPIRVKGIGLQIGAGLPLIVGVGFAYVTSMSTIVEGYGIATIFGAEIVGGLVAVLVGLSYNKIKVLFPPLVIGIVILCIGLSLYPIAIRYMAGGQSSPSYGSWQNWFVAIVTLIIVVICNNFGKGIVKLASILIGIIAGYIIAFPFHMVDFSSIGQAGIVQLPKLMHFGIEFEFSSCVAIGLLFAINSLQAVGDVSATTIGGMDRDATSKEITGGILGFGISNIIGAFMGGLPNVTFSQNVGIVSTTKVVNRWIAALAAIILGVAGIVPKFAAFLTSIPQCVLGGATLSVFAAITVTGIRMISNAGLTARNTGIVGIAVALGSGLVQASDALGGSPAWVATIFAKTPVVVAALVAILLNLLLPKDKK